MELGFEPRSEAHDFPSYHKKLSGHHKGAHSCTGNLTPSGGLGVCRDQGLWLKEERTAESRNRACPRAPPLSLESCRLCVAPGVLEEGRKGST